MFRKTVLAVAVALGFAASLASAQEGLLADLYGRGVHAYNAGDFRGSHELLSSAITQGYKDPRAFYYRGLAYLKLGRPEEAQSDFKAGAVLEANGDEHGYSIGRSLERVQGNDRLALENFRKSARLAMLQKEQQTKKERYEAFQETQKRVAKEPVAALPAEALVPGGARGAGEDPFGGAADAAQPAAAGADPFGGAAPAAAPADGAAPPAEGAAPAAAPADAAAPMPKPATDDPFGGAAPAAAPAAEKPAAAPAADDPFGGAAPAPAEKPAGEMKEEKKPAPGSEFFEAAAPAAEKPAAKPATDDPFGGPAPAPAPAPAAAPAGEKPAAAPAAADPFGGAPAPAAPAAPPAEKKPSADDLLGGEKPAEKPAPAPGAGAEAAPAGAPKKSLMGSLFNAVTKPVADVAGAAESLAEKGAGGAGRPAGPPPAFGPPGAPPAELAPGAAPADAAAAKQANSADPFADDPPAEGAVKPAGAEMPLPAAKPAAPAIEDPFK